MSKETLKKQIDALCIELDIADKPYKANSTVEELEAILADLESQEDGDDDGKIKVPAKSSGSDRLTVKARVTFETISDGETVMVVKGKTAQLEASAAETAIDEKLAVKVE